MKRQFSIIISLFFLVLPGSIANAADGASNIRVDYSCPGKVTVTYDLTTSHPTDITLQYSPNKSKWLDAEAVTGDVKAQTTGTGKTIVWDCFADNVRAGGFYFKIVLPSSPPPECVWINGVCWAPCNVDRPGTLVENPEDAGMLYRFNINIGWSSTSLVDSNGGTTWSSSAYPPGITTWEKANDPSPAGYRVPTLEELQTLLDGTKVTSTWTTQNGKPGRRFTDRTTGNSIFMPAVGFRDADSGSLNVSGTYGYYWSNNKQSVGNNGAYYMYFTSGSATMNNPNRNSALSVRPVAEN